MKTTLVVIKIRWKYLTRYPVTDPEGKGKLYGDHIQETKQGGGEEHVER